MDPNCDLSTTREGLLQANIVESSRGGLGFEVGCVPACSTRTLLLAFGDSPGMNSHIARVFTSEEVGTASPVWQQGRVHFLRGSF